MNVPQILGYAAVLLLIAAFAMNRITWLRILAIASNAAVVLYGIVTPHYPLLGLGLVMLAVNAWRLIEMRRLVGAAREATMASAAPVSVDWLIPYMRPVDLPKGHTLFRKGDIADAMYFVSSGRIRFEEINVEIGKGSLFGEIGILSIDQVRTATAVCLEPCALLLITADKARELYYQNPEFGFYLVGLITRRLIEDMRLAQPVKP